MTSRVWRAWELRGGSCAIKVAIVCGSLVAGLIAGCTNSARCFTADTVVPVKRISIAGDEHLLYLRSSGFSEKQSFYELYSNEPKFDDCGHATRAPLSKVDVDPGAGAVVGLVVDKHKLVIVYSKEGASSNLAGVPVEVRR